RVDPDPQEVLPVPVRPPVLLALLGLEYPDLGAAHGPHQGGADRRALDQRIAHSEAPLALALPPDHEDTIEADRVPLAAFADSDELDVEHVPGGYPVLLPTTLDHCVHERVPRLFHVWGVKKRVDGRPYHGRRWGSTEALLVLPAAHRVDLL